MNVVSFLVVYCYICLQATSWSRCIDVSIELKDVWRQSDRKFIDVLQHIRYGRCPDEVSSVLQATVVNRIESADIAATCLCTHNEDVDSINRAQLARLSGIFTHATCLIAKKHSTIICSLSLQLVYLFNIHVYLSIR